MSTNAAMDGKTIVAAQQLRARPGVKASLAAAIDAALAQAAHAAAAQEREECCHDVCGGCRYGVELVRTWTHEGKKYDLWLHIDRETLCVTPCQAAAIRDRSQP